MKTGKRTGLLILVLSTLVILSCNLTNLGSQNQISDLEQTQVAMDIQATSLALDQQIATQDALEEQAAQPLPTEAPPPTAVPEPTQIPTLEPTQPPAPEPSPEPTMAAPADIQKMIKSANILVYEDSRGNYDMLPYVQRTMERMNFSGGKVVYVADALGDFMKQLNSPVKWDLIIVAAENRNWVRGEFWDVIMEQINNNHAAVIAEVWTLDQIANGRISDFLYQCGIAYQADWNRPVNYDVLDYSMYWVDSSHPLISTPNLVEPLYTPSVYWTGDIGDLIRLGSSGDAQMVAGLYMREKSSYGTLATCMDGTVVVQTFSTHDYPRAQMTALWENYIVYTLTNHFEQALQ